MFSVIIKGRTMIELRSNMVAFLNGMDDFTVTTDRSQEAINKVLTEAPWQEPPPHFDAPVEVAVPEPTMIVSTSHAPPPILAVVPPPAATPNEFGLDSRGLPWDERVHSVSQGINKDGSWRTRRGVEPEFLKQVEAELRERSGQVAPPQKPLFTPHAPTAAFPEGVPVPPPVTLQPPQVVPQPIPVVAPAPPIPNSPSVVPPAQVTAHSIETFRANLPMTLMKLITDGKLSQEYLATLKAYFGVDQIWNVNAEQAAEMFEGFVQNGILVKV